MIGNNLISYLNGKKINTFPTAIIKSDNKIYYGNNDILKLLETVLNIKIIKDTITNNSKDTIQFFVAEWCGYSQKILPYIKEYKMQDSVNVEIINDNNISKELNITGYPTAIRKSDNKRAIGKTDILNLMIQTFEINTKQEIKTNVNVNFKQEINTNVKDNENTILVFLAEWCGYCQQFKPQLDEIMKKK